MIKDIKLSKLLELDDFEKLTNKSISLDSNFNLIKPRIGDSLINIIASSYFAFIINKENKEINIIKAKDIINLIIDTDEIWNIKCSGAIVLSNCCLLSSKLPINGPLVSNTIVRASVTCGIEDFVIIDKKILTKDEFMIKEIIE